MASNPEILYRSAAQTDPQPASPALQKFPLPPESSVQLAAQAFDVEFACVLDGVFPPAQKNTPASNAIFNSAAGTNQRNPNAILTGYSIPKNVGAGIGQWMATFHVVPASWDDVKTLPWTPPGWIGLIGGSSTRDIFTYNVNVRLHYDYYVIDPAGLASGVLDSGGAFVNRVNSISAIPIIQKNYFVATFGGVAQFNTHTNSIVPAAGVAGYLPTFPTVETYKKWVDNAAPFLTNGLWDNTHPTVWNGTDVMQSNVGQLVSDDSSIQPYAGNIIARISRYVLAI